MSDSIKSFREVSLTNIVRELLKSENVEKKIDLVSIIKNLVDTSSRSITAEDIQQNGIVGNYKFHTLKSKYPELFSSFTL
nr:MAG TPA: hypothetical protein [Bacteriophage sp.]